MNEDRERERERERDEVTFNSDLGNCSSNSRELIHWLLTA